MDNTFSKDILVHFNESKVLYSGTWVFGLIDKKENSHIKPFKDYPLITRSALAQAGLEVSYINKWNGFSEEVLPVILKNFSYNHIHIQPGSYRLARFRDTLTKHDQLLTGSLLLNLVESCFGNTKYIDVLQKQTTIPITSRALLPHKGMSISLKELSQVSGTNRSMLHSILGIKRWIPISEKLNSDEHFVLGKTDKLHIRLPENIYGVVSRLNRYADERRTEGVPLIHLNSNIIDPGFSDSIITEQYLPMSQMKIEEISAAIRLLFFRIKT